ncbi:MAG: hypothetical protein JWO44_1631 [Bacteroidetes bacterium]|nr:hypothetical protein [Bacteroidota bacterium]
MFLVLLLWAGCKKKQEMLDAGGYKQWVEKTANGLVSAKEVGDFEFAVMYKPIDYIVSMETAGKNIAADSIRKRMNELKGFQYYTLRIKSLKDNEFLRTGLHADNEYYERLEYFVSNAQSDIILVEGTDTIPCGMYHFERNYGISPYNNIILSFPEHDSLNAKDKIFIYDDKILGTGKVALRLSADELKELPKLDI